MKSVLYFSVIDVNLKFVMPQPMLFHHFHIKLATFAAVTCLFCLLMGFTLGYNLALCFSDKTYKMIINAEICLHSVAAALSWNVLVFVEISNIYLLALYTIFMFLFHIVLLYNSKGDLFQVTWRAYMLGIVFSIGLNVICRASFIFLSTGFYLCVLSLFHFGEYFATAVFNPSTIHLDSFILNHSTEYNLALLASWIEHGILLYFFPNIKSISYLIYFGLLMSLSGDLFRKVAMYTAGRSFNHIVQHYKRDNHVLITQGVYSLFRHPSYAGWFCWSISTQILLCNPVCLIAYAVASWKFFNERIYYEELTLLNFFQDQYVAYKKAVPSGIPFVEGYKL